MSVHYGTHTADAELVTGGTVSSGIRRWRGGILLWLSADPVRLAACICRAARRKLRAGMPRLGAPKVRFRLQVEYDGTDFARMAAAGAWRAHRPGELERAACRL